MASIEASASNSANAALEAFRARALNSAAVGSVAVAKAVSTRNKPFASPSADSSPAELGTGAIASRTAAENSLSASSKTRVSNLPEHINVDEIQQIAARAGYVGLTHGAIQRAYLYGESLLTDVRA